MEESKPKILIVDDEPADALVIQNAVKICLRILGLKAEILPAAGNRESALEVIKNQQPTLLITDLFMTAEKFSKLDLKSQCDEMEFPQGLRLLTDLQDKHLRKIVTTFFWNYPGFTRYSDYFYKHLEIDGAIPKDIFYLVGTLGNDTIADAAEFAPLRILIQAIYSLLMDLPKQGIGQNVNRLQFRSLFDEASAWLSTYPQEALGVRNGISILGQKPLAKPPSVTVGKQPEPIPMKIQQYEPWTDSEEIASHSLASPWMPSFVLISSTAEDTIREGFYATQMEEIRESNAWTINMEMSGAMAIPYEQRVPSKPEFEWNGRKLKLAHHLRYIEHMSLGTVLKPERIDKGDDHRHWAQLILTLGFFSYWCHLSDHRAVRTPTDIAAIIKDRTKKSYRNLKDRDVAASISEDIELLEAFLLRKIKHGKHNSWWRFMTRNRGVTIIGTKRQKGGEYGHWLNASLLLHGPERTNRTAR